MIFYDYSLEDAIKQAVRKFRCKRKDLKIKVLEEPSKKFFGVIRKPGKYEIVLKEDLEEHKPKESASKEVDDKDATPENENETSTKMKDKIGPISVEEPLLEIKARVTGDKMKAILTINRVPGRKYYESDDPDDVKVKYEEIPVPEPTLEQCINELTKIGVKKELIKIENIKEILKLQGSNKVVAAEGKPPVNGVDSKIDLFFERDNYRNPDFDTAKKVNLLDHTIIPVVQAGDTLAIKSVFATDGEDGMAVTGSVIKAKRGIDIPLKVGQGAELAENDTVVIATSIGRPSYQYGVISVMPELVLNKDVDVETGNINFDGDVTVRGNVKESMCITAGGNVIIQGNCYHANISAKGNIKIEGHILNCKVRAGESMVIFLTIIPLLKQLLEIIEQFNRIEIENNDNYKNEIRILLNKRANRINHIFKELDKNIDKLADADKDDVKKIIEITKRVVTGINALCINDPSLLLITYNEIDYYILRSEALYDDKSDVTFRYGQNSFVQANGNILVTDKGTYQCDLIARDTIQYTYASSVVRGGNLTAGKLIKMGSVGTISGNTTYCTVLEPGGKIESLECFNTILTVADETKTIN